jgi:hypothetical protein
MPLTPEQQAIYDEVMRVKPRDELKEWREYHDERDRARERETRRRQRVERETRMAAAADWDCWAEAHVQRGIDAYHELMIAMVGEALGTIRAELEDKFDEKLSALRRELTGKSAVVDMSERRRA